MTTKPQTGHIHPVPGLAERTGKIREARDRLVERLAAMTDGLDLPLPTLAKEMIVRIDRELVG